MAVQLEGLLLWSLGIVWWKISPRTSTISIKILKLPGLFDFFMIILFECLEFIIVKYFKEQLWLHIWGNFWSIRSIDTILMPPLPWGCHMFDLEFYTGCPSWCNPKGDLYLQLELDLQHWSLYYSAWCYFCIKHRWRCVSGLSFGTGDQCCLSVVFWWGVSYTFHYALKLLTLHAEMLKFQLFVYLFHCHCK